MYAGDSAVGIANPNWIQDAAEGLISETPEGLSVDWKKYWELWGLIYHPEMHVAFQNALLARGILSENPERHFLVIVRPLQWARQPSLVAVGPLTTDPILARTILFFTELKYVQDWVKYWPPFEEGAKYDYDVIQLSVSYHGSTVP